MTRAEAKSIVLSDLKARSASTEAIRVAKRLEDRLPNHRFSFDGDPYQPLSPGVVVGRIVEVRPGAAFTNKDDSPQSAEVPFDSPSALWRVVHLVIKVDYAWGKDVGAVDQLVVGLALSGSTSPEAAIQGPEGFGRVLLALRESGFFQHDPSLLGIAHSGSVLGFIDSADRISLPFAEPGFEGELRTIADLQAAADAPQQLNDVSYESNIPIITRRR